MTAPARRFELRPPKALRVYGWVFGAVWLTFASVSVVAAALDGTWGFVPFALAFVSVGGFLIVRMNRVAVIAEPDGLTIRNDYRTRRFARHEVEGFRVGPPAMAPLGRTVHVLTADTVVSADALMIAGLLPRGRRRLDAQTGTAAPVAEPTGRSVRVAGGSAWAFPKLPVPACATATLRRTTEVSHTANFRNSDEEW